MRTLRLLCTAGLALALAMASTPAAGQASEGEWTVSPFAEGLDSPVDIVFGPDGTLYYAELDSGKLRAIPPNARAPLPEALGQVASSRSENGGLLGLALDPDFGTTRAIFVYYSFQKAAGEGGTVNRVSRIDAAGERVILDDIPSNDLHNGGRLLFTGPDTLVVATGDNELRDPAQDMSSLLGKTLRMTREGKPAPDNPDPTSLVYTLGHRNVFGLAYDAESGTLWNTENGPQSDDEINILRAGENYGWPKVVGIARHPDYVDPVFAYEDTIGPTGATVHEGDLYLGAVNDGKVRRIHREADGSFTESVVVDIKQPILDVERGPDGRIYLASFGEISVLSPPGVAPPTVSPSAPPATTPGAPPATTPAGPPSATPPPSATAPPPGSGLPPQPAQIPGPGLLAGLAALAVAWASARRPPREED